MAYPSSDFTLSAKLTAPVTLEADLSCRGGETLALVGPSGSGKSTLLRAIAGLIRPKQARIQCGEVCWDDSDAGVHLTPQQRKVGFVPQHYGLFPHMNALANVMSGLHELPVAEREARARSWMQKVHLQGLEKHRPAELSGGQQQRVALARALAREPTILLLDEPFSAVDRVTRQTLYVELAELKRELAVPIIMVTHDLDEALLLASRMTLLAHGRTLQSGAPREVMARPASEAAARLLGVRNVFDAVVVRHDSAAQLTWIKAGEMQLVCPLTASMGVGKPVRWMVHETGVRLPAMATGDLPAGHNRVSVVVQSVLPLGEQARVSATLPGIEEPLHVSVSLRMVQELGLRSGVQIDVVLREQQMHILSSSSPD